jgi:hypothetical protein
MKRFLCALALVVFAAAPALADPKSDLMRSMTQFGNAGSYHITASGKGQTVDIDMVQPGKMHVVAGPMEMIKIDSSTWMKMNGKWQKFAMPGMDQMTAGINNAIATAQGKQDDLVVTDLGMKSPDGVPLHAYTVTNKAGQSPSTVYVNASGVLVRVDNTDGGVVTFSKFNAVPPIEPPI